MFFTKKLTKFIRKMQRKLDVLNRIEISREAIISNYHYFKTQIREVWPVVKSNAYGHGAERIAQILDSQKPTYFVVDSYYDGLKIMPHTRSKILMFGYNPIKNIAKIDFRRVTITIHDIATAKVLLGLKRKINAHLMVDTGMNRDGARREKLGEILEILKNQEYIRLKGVFSHLADSDGKTDEYTNRQISLFEEIVKEIKKQGFSPKYIHLANSFGIAKTKHLGWLSACRSGRGIYGYINNANLKPALRFVSTLVQKKEIKKGDKVGYNCTFSALHDMVIGVVPAGYYEGVDRRLSNKGHFYYQDVPLKILGRVCMNLTVVDLTSCSAQIKEGDEIEVVSPRRERMNSVENIAKICNTVPYEITTKLAESIRRIIIK